MQRAELEEDIGCHGIDPEHQAGEGIKDDMANHDTGQGVETNTATESFAEVSEGQANIGSKIVDDESEGDLSKEWLAKILIDEIGNKG